ncbi:hypothetical protein ALC62_02642 [Cyphomyrmex costatus]|uniref:Uncharacterized protein n=1 Tax=Cyphomyrmex costatus TaxID=456900 RepID=A0A151INA4_9HYME|nr:hypothetical protein ALC62_02642 [Cyphomyrmex costatus]
MRLLDECKNVGYINRNFNSSEGNYYAVHKITDELDCNYCRCIKIFTDSKKCAEVVMIDEKPLRRHNYNYPIVDKLCDEWYERPCSECGDYADLDDCEKCFLSVKRNGRAIDYYDIVDMQRCCKTCEQHACKCSE